MRKEKLYFYILFMLIVLLCICFYAQIHRLDKKITSLKESSNFSLDVDNKEKTEDYNKDILSLNQKYIEIEKQLSNLENNVNKNGEELKKYANKSDYIVGGGVSGSGSICESWGKARCSSNSGILCPEGYQKFQMRFLTSLNTYQSVHFCVIE